MKQVLNLSNILVLLFGLSACGGTRMLGDAEPLVFAKPLATASDQYLNASLDWVIFRGGPGTWAKNVDWDEYLLRVQNQGSAPFEIVSISVVDSLGTQVDPQLNRGKLVKGTKATKRRYKGEGVKVKAGMSGKMLVGTSVFVATGTTGLGAAAMAGGGAAAGAAGVVLLVPALAVGGIVRGVRNSKVNNEIESRQTLLPVTLEGEEEKTLDIFFPISPSPKSVEITYLDSRGHHTLTVDTRTALEGLHLTQAEK